MAPTITADRHQVTLTSAPGHVFRTASGAGGERDVTKRRNTPGGPHENIVGRTTMTDQTLTIGYSRTTMVLAERALKGDLFEGSIVRQALDPDDVPIPGPPTVFTGCILKSYSIPDADVDSADAGDLSFVFSVGGVA